MKRNIIITQTQGQEDNKATKNMIKIFQIIYKLNDSYKSWEHYSLNVCTTKKLAEKKAKEYKEYMEINGGNTKVESYEIRNLYLWKE